MRKIVLPIEGVVPLDSLPFRFAGDVRGTNKAAKAAGLVYERKVQKELETRLGIEGVSNQWFRFHDRKGSEFCQPDWYGVITSPTGAKVLLVEIKLSQKPGAYVKLQRLYKPILEKFLSLPVITLQVFRNINFTPEGLLLKCPSQIPSLGDSDFRKPLSWHWINHTDRY